MHLAEPITDGSYLFVKSIAGRTGWEIVLMGHHTDSGCCATPGAIKVALDSFTIDLLFGGVVVIHWFVVSHMFFCFFQVGL
jgi:hypothetical protein